MSIHSSLSSSLKNRKQRSVLKRIERIKYLMGKGSFSQQSSVFGLPKIKSLKLKVKKEKTEEKATAAAATASPAAGAGASKASAKAAAPSAKPAK